jgi:DNA-binding GntR family transcriptional regulator
VEIRRGKGTFVTHPKVTQELTELTGFVEDMQAAGRQPTAKVLDQQIVAANQVVARRVALPQGAPVVRIQRVRLADGMPISYDETYLPKQLGEKVMADNLTTEPISRRAKNCSDWRYHRKCVCCGEQRHISVRLASRTTRRRVLKSSLWMSTAYLRFCCKRF